MADVKIEMDPAACRRYHEAATALTAADRAWLLRHGWHDNAPKPYPEHGYMPEHFEPVYRIEKWASQ